MNKRSNLCCMLTLHDGFVGSLEVLRLEVELERRQSEDDLGVVRVLLALPGRAATLRRTLRRLVTHRRENVQI